MVTRLKKIVFRSNGQGYPKKKKCSCRTAFVIHLQGTAVFQTANVTCSGMGMAVLFIYSKLISRLIGQWYLMGFGLSNGWDYLFRRNFIQPPEWLCLFKTNIQPF